MDQKDSNTHMKKLASAAELRGKKSGAVDGKGGKKKMWISLISMVVVLAVAIGVYFLSGIIKPEEEEAPAATSAPSTTVKVVDKEKQDVDRVTVKANGQKAFTIVNEVTEIGEGENITYAYNYVVDGKPEFQLNQSKAGTIIGYAANMTATQQIAEGVSDFSDYGLDKPSMTVTMKYKNGTQTVWNFGNKAPTSSGYYACEKGSNTVFLIYSSAYSSLAVELNDLYTLPTLPTISDTASISDLLIEQAGKDTVELRYRTEEETSASISTLVLVQPVFYDAHSDRSEEIMQASIDFAISGYAGEIDELPDCGLTEPRAHVCVTGSDGVVLDYRVGNYCGSDQVYVQVDDTNAVYLADASLFSFLDNVSVSYLVDQFANLVNIQKVDAMTIQANGEQFDITITREPILDEDGVQKTNASGKLLTDDTYTFNGEITEETRFKKLYQVIIGTLVSKVSDDWDIDGEVVVSVDYQLNAAPYAFRVEYIEYDDEYYAVRRDGQTLFLIKREKIDNVVTKLGEYRDGTFVVE